MNHSKRILQWMMGLPGSFYGQTVEEAYRAAWKACGVECEFSDFRKWISNSGYAPRLRNSPDQGSFWELALPAPQPTLVHRTPRERLI